VRRTLQRDGWQVREAENGAAALESLDQVRPSLILLDLMMPVMDGFAFLRALRGRPDGDSIPVVVLTAKEITSEEKESLGRQADRLIVKGTMSLSEIGRQLRDLYSHQDGTPLPGKIQSLIDKLSP
jgi:CheY-like chemotaxis protein